MAQVSATSIAPKTLSELVADADHVVIAKVVKVDAIDEQGQQVTGKAARTGPGSKIMIRLHLEVAGDGTLYSTGKPKPKLVVPLWNAWHASLKHKRSDLQGKTFIFLLKGEDYQIVYPAAFMRGLGERETIEKHLESK